MAASHIVLVSLLTLCVSCIAFAIECPLCSNVPVLGAKTCNNPENVKCAEGMDSCVTIKGIMSIQDLVSLDIEIKNCTHSALCNPDNELSICNLFNSSGYMASCSFTCAEPSSAVRGLGMTASLGVILLALILNMF